MLGFADSFLPWIAATLIPAFVGLLMILLAGNFLKAKYLSGFALGIFLWFFVDTIGGAASLDVSSGFTGGGKQIALSGLFTIGLLFFFSLDRNRNLLSPQLAIGKYGLAIPWLVAAAVGIHGLGEGAAFGGTAALTSSTSLLAAFGGYSGGVAYILHKALEPMMIGAGYCVYAKDHEKRAVGRLRDILLLSITFVIPSLLGAVTGYLLTYDSSYFYALGTGTAIYALIRLTGPLFDNTSAGNSRDPIRIALLVAIGLLLVYFASLFHSG
jgi:hypothetical protein